MVGYRDPGRRRGAPCRQSSARPRLHRRRRRSGPGPHLARYHESSSQLAAVFAQAGLGPGDRLGVVLPDGATVHAVLLAAEKAGLVAVGIGARAGRAELRHLLARTGATALVTHADLLGQAADDLVASLRVDGLPGLRHLVVPDVLDLGDSAVLVDGSPVEAPAAAAVTGHLTGRALGPDDLFMINSTSGTTGLPKCVLHTENRWFYFHQLAAEAGALTSDDVFFGAVPAPFGFGLWTAHFSPGVLGCPTVLAAKFDVERTLRAVVAHRVSVLACVSTQFIMMLNSPLFDQLDLSSLRVMFTGGEAVPFARAAAFEDLTGAKVLQFYGSNETGVLSGTRLTDSRERRFGTAGRVIDAMQVRVYDDRGVQMTGTPLVGIPACKGPATCVGYLDDDDANAQLFTDDGWMLMGDVVEIDDDGYLRVIGRTSDIIIRGGKNISAPVGGRDRRASRRGSGRRGLHARRDVRGAGLRLPVHPERRCPHSPRYHGVPCRPGGREGAVPRTPDPTRRPSPLVGGQGGQGGAAGGHPQAPRRRVGGGPAGARRETPEGALVGDNGRCLASTSRDVVSI